MEAFSDGSAGSKKLQQSEYLGAGEFSVVDQGEKQIAGYTDDESFLSRTTPPVVVFGDHTRRFKFVDHPFVVGADGVKILIPKPTVDAKYGFHYLQSITLPTAGYSRHFKFLREVEIPLPPLPEQRRIADILDRADDLRTQRRRAIEMLERYLAATFERTFGPFAGPTTRWPTRELQELTLKISDGTHHSPPITHEGVPYVTAKHLKRYGLDFDSAPWFISETDHHAIYSRCDPKLGDVLYIKDGATTGLAAVNHYDFEFSMLSSLALIRPDNQILTPDYLSMWLNHPKVSRELIGGMSGAAIKRLTLAKIKKFAIPVPPVDLQLEFSNQLAAVDRLRLDHQKQVAQLDELFASLQHRAFQGEL